MANLCTINITFRFLQVGVFKLLTSGVALLATPAPSVNMCGLKNFVWVNLSARAIDPNRQPANPYDPVGTHERNPSPHGQNTAHPFGELNLQVQQVSKMALQNHLGLAMFLARYMRYVKLQGVSAVSPYVMQLPPLMKRNSITDAAKTRELFQVILQNKPGRQSGILHRG